jgi:hypothetical protein
VYGITAHVHSRLRRALWGAEVCGNAAYLPSRLRRALGGVEMCGGAVYVPSCLRRALRGAEVYDNTAYVPSRLRRALGGRRCAGLRRTSLRACGAFSPLPWSSTVGKAPTEPRGSPAVGVMRGGGMRHLQRALGGGGVRDYGARLFTPAAGVTRGGCVRDCGIRPFALVAGVRGSGGVRTYGARPFAPAAGGRGSGGVRTYGARLFVPISCGAFSPLPWSSTVGMAPTEPRGTPTMGVRGAEVCDNAAYVSSFLYPAARSHLYRGQVLWVWLQQNQGARLRWAL